TNSFEGCINVSGNWQWQAFGGSCDGLGYAAAVVYDPSGNACTPVCPAMEDSGATGNSGMVRCNNNTCGTITLTGGYSFPNGKLGDVIPPEPSIYKGIGTVPSCINGMHQGNVNYYTCTPTGWKQTNMANNDITTTCP